MKQSGARSAPGTFLGHVLPSYDIGGHRIIGLLARKNRGGLTRFPPWQGFSPLGWLAGWLAGRPARMLLLPPNTLKNSRRASRAGLLHFPKVFVAFETKYPKKFPARFARRIASLSYGFCCFLSPNTLKFSRRASRAGLLHFPMVFAAFGPQMP